MKLIWIAKYAWTVRWRNKDILDELNIEAELLKKLNYRNIMLPEADWLHKSMMKHRPTGTGKEKLPLRRIFFNMKWGVLLDSLIIMTASFRVLSYSSFTCNPFIRRCMFKVTEISPLNKLQTIKHLLAKWNTGSCTNVQILQTVAFQDFATCSLEDIYLHF
jgi:hypothetical protein